MGACSSSKEPPKAESNLRIKNNLQPAQEQGIQIEAKIVLLGDQNVGKSSIAQRFCKNLFTGQHVATIGGAYLQQRVVLNNGVSIKYHIWDTGGQERFRSMASLYYRDAVAAILTYDIANEKTFESLNYWVEELRSMCQQDKMVLCLAGNKCDKDPNDRQVMTNVGRSKFYY